MRLAINTSFAILTTVLYGFSASLMLWNVMNTAGYVPSDAQTTMSGLTGGAVVAFLIAQLGLAAGNPETGASDSLKAALSGDAAQGRGDLILGFVAIIFTLVGLWYIALWLLPDWFVQGSGGASTQAPQFVALQGKAFLGILVAGFAAIAGAAGGSAPAASGSDAGPQPPLPGPAQLAQGRDHA
jgi:hypothetical protein